MVKFIDESRSFVEASVIFGENVVIWPDVYLVGNTIIGDNVIIYPGTFIENSLIGNNSLIYSSHIFDSEIGEYNKIGPYAHIRKNTLTSSNCKIGSFSETKNIDMSSGSKIPHLSYISDCKIGNNVNIGCGVITANYDGKLKSVSVIRDNSFVGCNSVLVAPVEVGENTYVAAGSIITEDVPDNALAIAREYQVNKENYINPKKR